MYVLNQSDRIKRRIFNADKNDVITLNYYRHHYLPPT